LTVGLVPRAVDAGRVGVAAGELVAERAAAPERALGVGQIAPSTVRMAEVRARAREAAGARPVEDRARAGAILRDDVALRVQDAEQVARAEVVAIAARLEQRRRAIAERAGTRGILGR